MDKKHILPFLIFLFPFVFAFDYIAFDISYKFANYYFLPILGYLLLHFASHFKATMKAVNKTDLALMVAILAIVGFNTNSLTYVKPLYFFTYFILFYFYSFQNGWIPRWLERGGFFLFLLLSFIFLWSDIRFDEGRFLGFQSSPTVFSVYAEAILVYSVFSTNNHITRTLILVIGGVFVVLARTRLNLLFLGAIPVLAFISERLVNYRKAILVVLLLGINLFYPAYELMQKSGATSSTMTLGRYKTGTDRSFGVREKLKNLVLNDFVENKTWTQKLFGSGAEKSRILVIEKWHKDIFPHMDFLRLTYDFGIIFMILFLVLLFRISIKSHTSFVLIILYLISFYHNMVYDFFQISLILLFAFRKKNFHPEGKTGELVHLGRIKVHYFTESSLHQEIKRIINSGEKRTVLNSNAHLVVLANSADGWLLDYFEQKVDYVVCDGSGLQLAARILDKPVPEKITYNTWFPRFAGFCAENNFSIFLLGGKEDVAREAAENLQRLHPNLTVFHHHGYFNKETESVENQQIIQLINETKPHVLVTCFGMPVQEKYVMNNFEHLHAKIFMTGGGALDFISGRAKVAPLIFRKLYLEWLFRMLQEPGRLWKRYLIGNFLFLYYILRYRNDK